MTLKNLVLLVKTDRPILIRYGGMEPARLTPEIMARMGDKTIRCIDITPINDMIVELEDEAKAASILDYCCCKR